MASPSPVPISFVQEQRAEQAITALQRMSTPQAHITRAGQPQTVPATELVPGDLLHLEAGDVLPADARLLEAPNLRVNEAALTGESVPVDQHPAALAGGQLVLADQHNMVFKGTAVSYGRGRAIVTATGMRTALGQIAELLATRRPPPTPLQRRLATLGRVLALAVVAISAVVFAVGVAAGEPASRMLLAAVSLAVAAIPESLPAVVTLSLALGAHRMARQQAIIRKLPAVETLGSVTVIATDKTGTLTQGRMQAERVWTAAGEVQVSGTGYTPDGEFTTADDGGRVDPTAPPLGRLLLAGALANDAHLVPPASAGEAWEVTGDPTEGALLALAAKAGLDRDQLAVDLPRVAEVPFDSTRKRMTTLHRTRDGQLLVASKGAIEALEPLLAALAGPDGPRPITPADQTHLHVQAEAYAAQGYRVLAVAGRQLTALPAQIEDAERDLVLYGLVAMADPPRPEAAQAVTAAQQAGIHPIMITGDHPATARAIAARLGILDGHQVLSGADLAHHGPGYLADHVADIAVYARTTPEQKLDIVEAWKARGQVVAMTGDGVNDAPTLRRADIGVAMGKNGTEVSKQPPTWSWPTTTSPPSSRRCAKAAASTTTCAALSATASAAARPRSGSCSQPPCSGCPWPCSRPRSCGSTWSPTACRASPWAWRGPSPTPWAGRPAALARASSPVGCGSTCWSWACSPARSASGWASGGTLPGGLGRP
jgi:P-type Ca2+ transporter type 2C